MASVFRRKRTIKGRKVEAKKYTIQYTDANGKTCRVAGYSDKSRSWDLARKLDAGAAVADQVKHRKTPLTDHLDAFKRHLEAQNNSDKHVSQTETHIQAILDGCEFVTLRDVNLPDVEDWLATQRGKKVFGIKTSNYYARDFKSFLKWLVDSNRAETNPLARFNPLNAETDASRERRALDADDFAKLVEATIQGPVYRRVNGLDRAMLYFVAAYTGLRASELASLTPESFDLDAGIVSVQAAHSKRRRKDQQPLRSDLVALLRQWLPSRSGKLWCGSWWNTAAAMLQIDLTAASLPYVDSAGRVYDFHALRHQFISGLAQAGVPPKIAQVLARHSTIVLTMDRYSHLGDDDATAALAKLPAIPAEKWTQKWTQSCVLDIPEVAQVGTTAANVPAAESDRKPLPDLYLSQPVASCYGMSEEALVGVEPTMADLQSGRNRRNHRRKRGRFWQRSARRSV